MRPSGSAPVTFHAMDPVIGLLGTKLLDALVSAATRRIKTASLGGAQVRALEVAVRQSSEAVTGRHPELAAISAEIDLMSDDSVVNEVVAAATGERAVDWIAAGRRWRDLYGTEPPAGFLPLLRDLAEELSGRLRGDPELQMVFLVSATSLLVDRTAEIGYRVDAIRDDVAAQWDPVRAVRARGEEIGNDLDLVSKNLGQVGLEMSRGPLRAIDLDVSLTETGAAFHIKPKAGTDVTVSLTMKALNSPDGRDQLASLRSAFDGDDKFEIPEAEVVLETGGIPFRFPSPVRVSAEPIRARHRAVLEFRGRGLSVERFLVDLDIASVDGNLRGETSSDTPNSLRVRFEGAAGGVMRFNFAGNPDVATVRTQVKMARLGRHLKRGAKVILWFAEMDVAATSKLPPNSAYDASDRDHEILKLFEEVQRRVGAEVSQVDELTPGDVIDLRMAKRLLDTGRATLPGRGGTFTMTSGDDIRLNVAPTAVKRGRLSMRAVEPERKLQLSRHPLPLGPVATTFTVFWPPMSVTKRDDGNFVSELKIDPGKPVRLERISSDQALGAAASPSSRHLRRQDVDANVHSVVHGKANS